MLLNPSSANLAKWSNTLKKSIGKDQQIVFNHFVGLALKGLSVA